jgi:energy-converting hydrogenase Eha subunit E
MDATTIIGVIGATIILVSFLLNQFGIWSTDSRLYDVANTVGSLVLMVYAHQLQSLPFFILNTVWFLVSARDVLRSANNKK